MMNLSTPNRFSYQYEITINEHIHSNVSIQFIVNTVNDKTSSVKVYQLPDKQHSTYLSHFQQLANDFNFRLPQNRKPQILHTDFNTDYTTVLTQNISPHILYGYGDPAVVQVQVDNERWYYLVTTSNDAPNSFPILKSQNLTDWELTSFAFPENNKPLWAMDGEHSSDYWAPEIHQIGSNFWMCFVARDKETAELCIGLAKSVTPEGPYIAFEKPIIKGNVIDPHLYAQDDGTILLFWKEDNNDVWPSQLISFFYKYPELISQFFTAAEDQKTVCYLATLWPWLQTQKPIEKFMMLQVFIEAVTSRFSNFYYRFKSLLTNQENDTQAKEIQTILEFMKTPMFAQPLHKNGLKLLGEKTKIIENDQEWEAHLVEGMWLTKQNNKYYLFYAGNDFSTDQYGIGVAIATTPLGPYQKVQKPLLQSTTIWKAPGHPSVTNDLNGNPLLFLHAYYPESAGYKKFRALLSVPLIFEEDNVRILTRY